MKELDQLLAAIDQENPDVRAMLADGYVSRVLKLVQSHESYKVDEAAIDAELTVMAQDLVLEAWNVDGGLDALQSCVDARFRVLAVRDRYVALYKALSLLAGRYERIQRACMAHLQGSEAASRLSQKAFDTIAKVALDPIVSTEEAITRLLKVLAQGLTHLDQKSRMIDAWYTIHERYRYENGKTRPHGNQRDPEEEDRQAHRTQAARRLR